MVSNILSWLVWLPVAGMVAILFIPREKADVIKIVAAVATGLQLWLAIMVWLSFDTDSGIFHSWLSFKYRPLPLLTFNFKVSRSSDYPTTTIINGINVEGQNVDNPFVHEQQFNFRIQIDYAI